LIVVEGLHARGEKIQINGGQNLTYDDWFGASFQNASLNPIQLPSNENKMVFAPHFYSPSVYPADYFFQSKPNVVEQIYPEYSNDVQGNKQLQQMMTIVLENAFGKIIEKTGVPVFYGEFGGIYGKEEELKEKTSTRAIDFMIQYAQKKGMSGGFTWSLNPDGVYNFNDKYIDPQTKEKPWNFGLYEDKTYKKYRTDYATGLRQLKGNGIIPCFKVVSDTATDSDLTTEKNTTGTTTTEPAKP
jgi:endoglucanase